MSLPAETGFVHFAELVGQECGGDCEPIGNHNAGGQPAGSRDCRCGCLGCCCPDSTPSSSWRRCSSCRLGSHGWSCRAFRHTPSSWKQTPQIPPPPFLRIGMGDERRQPRLLLDFRQPHPSPTPPSSHSTQKLQQPLPGSYTRSTETTRRPRKKAFRASSDIPSKDAGRANVANWLMSHSPCAGGRRSFAPRTRALRGTSACPAPSIQSWGAASRKPRRP